jgi:hypothetical protein
MSRTRIGLKEIGSVRSVPDSATAKLMYYLDSMCHVLDMGSSDYDMRRLRDFDNYARLSAEDKQSLVILCYLLSPDELMGKCIFQDDDESMCGTNYNAFYELSAVSSQFLVTENILLGGQSRRVHKIMFFKASFLVKFWMEPMKALAEQLERPRRDAIQFRPRQKAPSTVNSATSDNSSRPHRRPRIRYGCCTIL